MTHASGRAHRHLLELSGERLEASDVEAIASIRLAGAGCRREDVPDEVVDLLVRLHANEHSPLCGHLREILDVSNLASIALSMSASRSGHLRTRTLGGTWG